MSAGYYQKTKKSFKKSLMKGNKIFLKKKKTKSERMTANAVKIFLNVENKD